MLASTALLAAPTGRATSAAEVDGARFFEDRVRPVLAENCFRCHGETKQKGGLRLDSRQAMLVGGTQGPAIVPRQPQQSLLVKAIRQEDEQVKKMPPTKKLAPPQIADLIQWIRAGAPWPELDKTAAGAKPHWAFQPLRQPGVPTVRDPAWVANPIDAFILAKLEAAGLGPNPPAARHELIRRVVYDLTGLPPSPQEVDAFVADTSPRAYEDLIDRLLGSPRYGEKWGRHWLDLVRFAETNSYERDGAKPFAWRYRDYVIRSFNQDKPYDQFVREQLAGDELTSAGSEGLVATGYYRLGIWDDEPADAAQARYDGLDDIVTTTGQVFLGLTLDCARCHNHKREPIPQKDYYRLLAFFQNINHYRNQGPTDFAPIGLDESGKLAQALCVTEAGGRAPDTFLLRRGSPGNPGERVEPGFPEIFGVPDPAIPTPPPGAKTSGRRTVLANWLVSRENPLTARVIVNRVWQYHFGRGIVRSPNDFGTKGDPPTHPELLDWLATELLANGWRLKPLHRLILTSNAYQMSSRGNPTALAQDPVNDRFWRFDMRRLSAEEVRDSLLALSGTLNLKMYGPGIYPEIPPEVLAGQSRPGDGWGKSPPQEQARRSVYVHIKRSLLPPILADFDPPETDRTSPVRFATTQPTQALVLLNGAFLNRQAALFAERVRREAGGKVEAQVALCLRVATAREPTAAEVHRGLSFIEELKNHEGVAADVALKDFSLLVLNLNEFMYLD
jgi:mono/diheme cytochrome c family protein